MRYRFNECEFDSESLILTNNGKALAIRHTEAKVLAVLLEQRDTVLNKDDILNHVWQNKIVSEQVVFQNISNLRSLFGNNSIKTFPKRGYQWQLNTETSSSKTQEKAQQHSQEIHEAPPQPSSSVSAKNRSFWQLSGLLCIIVIATLAAFYSQNELTQEKSDSVMLDSRIKLAYIPMINLDESANAKPDNISLESNKNFDFTELSHLNTELFEDNTGIEYPKLSKTHPYILTGKFRTYKQQTYLDFIVKGPATDWRGLLSGSSRQSVIKQLQQHLKQQIVYDIIAKPLPLELEQAKLSIAHQVSPNDLIILRKLSIVYLKTNELEKAMAMTDKLINLARSQKKPQHIGKALAYQSKILTRKKLYDLSAQKLKLSMLQFEKINDLKHQARAWYYQSWLDNLQQDYPAIRSSLLKSAQFALGAKNKLGEIEALIHLAVMADKYRNNGDKYLYLQQAENKIKDYQLPTYHFALISYRYAAFATALSEKEPHLKQVLKLTAFIPEHWAAQSSRRQLMQYYLTQNRLVEAQALIDSVSSVNANNSYLKALMAQAKQQTSEMINHAQRTFEQAQLAGNRSLSLDVALLLCKQQVNCDFYSQYIKEHASENWRSTNDIKKLALAL